VAVSRLSLAASTGLDLCNIPTSSFKVPFLRHEQNTSNFSVLECPIHPYMISQRADKAAKSGNQQRNTEQRASIMGSRPRSTCCRHGLKERSAILCPQNKGLSRSTYTRRRRNRTSSLRHGTRGRSDGGISRALTSRRNTTRNRRLTRHRLGSRRRSGRLSISRRRRSSAQTASRGGAAHAVAVDAPDVKVEGAVEAGFVVARPGRVVAVCWVAAAGEGVA
jgi:hypothetical protein